MNRRRLLASLAAAGGGAATTGCLGLGAGTGIVSKRVEHVEPRRLREEKSTIVAFNEDATTIQILGFMYYGSSSCNRVELDSARYDDNADELRVVVTSKSANQIPFIPMGCTADMAATWYRVTVEFADELPGAVTVVEQQGYEGQTRTVNRTEQQELCTSEPPPNSTEARTAHWSCPEQYIVVNRSANATDAE